MEVGFGGMPNVEGMGEGDHEGMTQDKKWMKNYEEVVAIIRRSGDGSLIRS